MKYADKHQHVAACYVPACDKDAHHLEFQHGVLAWFCEEHRKKPK